MAPSSGGTCPFQTWNNQQIRKMNEELQVLSGVCLPMPPEQTARFKILGNLGPMFLPIVCNAGFSQTARRVAERVWKVIWAMKQKQNALQVECRQLWLLHAHSSKCPFSSFWMETCAFGVPEVDPAEWQSVCKAHLNSEPLQKLAHTQVQKLAAEQTDGGGLPHLPSQVHNARIRCALHCFGLPQVPGEETDRPQDCDKAAADMSLPLGFVLRAVGVPHRIGESGVCAVAKEGLLVGRVEELGLPKPGSHANRQRADPLRHPVCCGDALTPVLISTMASLQACFAYLTGMRVGEASHPGPISTKDSTSSRTKFDPHTGVRIGEAKNPGPSPFGPELENMIKQYVLEAVREAIKEAFQSLGLNTPASHAQSVGAPSGGQQVSDTVISKPEKGSSKGKGKPQKQAPNDKVGGKGKETTASKTSAPPKNDKSPDPPATVTSVKRGKGQGQAADNEWKLVTRQPRSGDFQLRAQDWNAPVIPFNKLSAAIDANKADAVLEGVILAEKQEIEHAKLMLQGSKVQYKFLLIHLAKDDKSQKIPGRIQDQLCFRDAIVLQCHSSAVGSSPTPAGLADAPIKVAPLQSVTVYVRVPKQYVSEQLWTNFRKNASKAAATWAADRHVQPLDSFNWAEEKQRTGGQELQVFGIMRVPKKDMSTLLAVSGQQGVFIEPCRSQAPRMKISWIERVKGETANQYLTRATQHGADFGVAVHGGRLGWRLAAQPDELLPRVWTLPWLPMHWDDDAVKQLLTSEFKDIDLLTHRRQRGNLSYRFRATCLKGDKDLVALLAETDTGPLTLWASVAPARTLQKSQRKLPQGAVPVVAPRQRSTAFPTTSKALTEPEIGTDGKPVPGAKRTKCDVRTVPNELKTIDIAKDGNCVYRAISEGLAWLSDGKISVEHRELRAKAITHLRKHKEAYSAQWDKESPAGAPMQSFEDYLVASAQDSAYGSPLEIEALARVYDVQIILIPCLADFAVMSFRTSQAKRIIVLWYHDKHIDLLIPKDAVRKYPQAVLNITTGPVHKLRAGGRSTCSKASKTASVWTIGARSSVSLDKGLDRSSVWSRAPSDLTLCAQPQVSTGTAKTACSSSRDSGRVGVVVSEGKVGVGTPCLPPRPLHPGLPSTASPILRSRRQRMLAELPVSASSPKLKAMQVRIFPDALQRSRSNAFTGRLNVDGRVILFV